jgi:ubiquinone/menaquinone biosynthesis C-methylase UbiE
MSHDWYKEAFADDYLWLYAHRDESEAARQVAVAVKHLPFERGQKILDIACGAGRHLIPFARRGAGVTGVDLSPVLLKLARKRFRELKLPVTLRSMDMRRLSYDRKFDGATIWFTSFGYFPTVADDYRVIQGLKRALKPGGWWWIDLPNPAYLQENLVPISESKRKSPHGMALVSERRKIVGRKVIKKTTIHDAQGVRTFEEKVRLYRPEQFGELISKAGLATDGILGDYDGAALASYRPRQIWFGRKLVDIARHKNRGRTKA